MFAPIDPRGGSPQYPAYADGFGRGATYSFLIPGAGQLARGGQAQYQPPQGILQQLIQQHLQANQFNQALGNIGSFNQSDLQGRHPGGLHRGGGYIPPSPLSQHHEMVGAAQNLARFLAQQHTSGLRRFQYNGRH